MITETNLERKNKTKTQLVRACLCFALLLSFSPSLIAKDSASIFGLHAYTDTVPTAEQVLGHSLGSDINWTADARRYFEALQDYAPQNIRIVDYGTSWEGRTLFYVVLSSEKNIAKLAEIKNDMRRLADPRQLSESQVQTLIENTPAVTWLSYSVHGNEISPTEAAMATAYHLLASTNDPVAKAAMEETVTVLVPVQNPDGRDRFVHHFEMARGPMASANMDSAEHNEPWPRGRTNHYLFDLNRDWFAQTQPEVRAHARAFLEWMPVAFVDAHEMGSDSTYFFAPEAEPYNPFITVEQRASLIMFGKTNAQRFDDLGIDYFTREVFDAFYPGYGASWPIYHGAIAMTYEQGSARGLVATRYDGSQLTYAETVRNHFVASLATIETVAGNRQKLLRQFYEYRRSAIDIGMKGKTKSYIFTDDAGSDAGFIMAQNLSQQGIEVRQSLESFRLCGQNFDAGSYFLNLDQPASRLIQTLLEKQVDLPAEFLRLETERSEKRQASQIYDVTAWSLPLMHGVETKSCARLVTAPSKAITDASIWQSYAPSRQAKLAYLVPWGSRASGLFLTKALRAGVHIKSSNLAFKHQQRRYGRGTLIINVHSNDPTIHDVMQRLATETSAEIVAVDDSWVSEGPNFGSGNVIIMQAPKIALLWDEPTNAYSAGSTRYLLEQIFEYPVTAVRTQSLGRIDLAQFDVLLMPDGRHARYLSALGKSFREALRRWVNNGGVLISLDDATSFLAHPDVNLLSIRRERLASDLRTEAAVQAKDKYKGGSAVEDSDSLFVAGSVLDAKSLKAYTAPQTPNPKSVAGAIARAEVEPDHWLSVGLKEELHPLVTGSAIYTPLREDQGANVVRFAAADQLLASGFMWDWNRQQLAHKPYVVAQAKGSGMVIGFTQDPNFRGQQHALNLLFVNAIFRGFSQAQAGG